MDIQKKGESAESYNNKPESRRYTLICVMSAYEILSYEIIDTTQKGVNGPRFVQSIEDLSILMDPNSILMTDNARIHHINDVAATMDDLDLYYAITTQ